LKPLASARYQLGDVRDKTAPWVDVPKPDPLATVIHNALLNALAYTDGNVLHAARLLKVGRSTLLNKLEAHGIPRYGRGARADKTPRKRTIR
jgi:transcriptional regulator of acetoin/glycerol metabolism